jgi:hypothetical protein
MLPPLTPNPKIPAGGNYCREIPFTSVVAKQRLRTPIPSKLAWVIFGESTWVTSPERRSAKGSLVRTVETDRTGHFEIDRLSWGRYKVFAKKEEAGYPDVRWSFYSNDNFPVVPLTPAVSTSNVRIQLGPRAGALTGSVTNSATGTPVDASFKLTRKAAIDKWISLSVSPEYRVLLPGSTDVLVEATAPGFERWTSPAVLRLESGAEMRLDIQLQPVHDSTIQDSEFLIPDEYIGWLRLEYGVTGAEPIPIEGGVRRYKFSRTGRLSTSSPGPEPGAERRYMYHSDDGSVQVIPSDRRGGKGLIWGQHDGFKEGAMRLFEFFVGDREAYEKYRFRTTVTGPVTVQ